MHKGIMMESVRVTGRAGHSSNPALGQPMGTRAQWHHPEFQGADPGAAEDPGAGNPDQPAGTGESDFKKGYRSIDVGRARSYALIDQLREQEAVDVICSAFDVAPSSYYEYKQRRQAPKFAPSKT